MRHPSSHRFSLVSVCTALLLFLTLRSAGFTGLNDEVPVPQPVRGRPDIVLVTIDALREDHVSAYGYHRFTTPAIERFSETAVTFASAISQAPYTKASVASIMSGLYPSTHKAVTVTVPFDEAMTGHPSTLPATTDVLSPSVVTLAERLKASGYTTLGFTANPFLIEPFGFARGFDVFQFFPGGDFANASEVVAWTLDHVRHSAAKPIFLWVHLMEPHSPYAPPPWTIHTFPPEGTPRRVPRTSPPPPWLLKGSPVDLRLYEDAYDEEVLAADTGVDTLLRGLQDLRDMNNAVVVLTADHGEEFLEHGGWEHSDSLYDELIRVPLIVRAPDTKPAIVKSQVQLVDLYPTLLEYAKIAVPPDVPGRSLVARTDTIFDAEPAFSEIAGSQYAVRTEDWKLIVSVAGPPQLFNLRADPQERRNLADQNPSQVEHLSRLLSHFLTASIQRGAGINPESAPVSPVILERLRALGYVGK
jgi:arylsulfatase A-like enzyme